MITNTYSVTKVLLNSKYNKKVNKVFFFCAYVVHLLS